MKKDGKYRYSLQFGSDSKEEIRAGELLERLGNRKSVVVVAALNEYLAAHPDLENPRCRIEVKVDSGYDRREIEKIIRAIVEEKLGTVPALPADSGSAAVAASVVIPDGEAARMLEEDVAQMLDNLDMFQ